MTVRVRGRLVNVAINGVHRVAYLLPVKREAGRFDLALYDSAVEFDSIEVRQLPDSFDMVRVKRVVNLAAAKLVLATAQQKLIAAQLKAAAIKAAYAADRAKAKLEGVGQVDQLIKQAAVVARKYELAQANAMVAQKRQEMSAAVAGKRSTAKSALAAAEVQQKKARAALAKPGKKYFTIRTTLRAPNGMTDEAKPRQGPYSPVSSGRRTALAKWIINRNNPLTARVAINHIWQRHFGQPLVASMTDFGLRTKRPAQHRLLDWLAIELMESGWRMKHIHKLIVTSRAYQLASSLLDADAETMRKDAKNDYYWRRKPIRMESQVVRDSILHLAGVLDRKMGGPTIDPSREDTVYRRSMYFTHSRDKRSKFISMFDDADILRCYRRKESIVPQQALALSNSRLALKMSRLITARIQKTQAQKSDREFVEVAFETLLLTPPTSDEMSACLDAIQETLQLLKKRGQKQPTLRARENLVHALLNHNDFITVR